MNRTDRLYAVTEELRRSGRRGATSARLARTFEVSERTIKRDIDALQQSGLPICAQAGPGGGYVLDSSASLPPINFTPRQAVAVAVALATLPPGSPFVVDAAAAGRKIWDTLADAAADRAGHLAARVWMDHGAPSTPGGQPPAAPNDGRGTAPVDRDAGDGEPVALSHRHLRAAAAVEESLATSRVLAIGYRDADGARTERRIEPILLAHTRGQWYVVAWDRLRADVRWFALQRILRADLTAESYRPRDVDIVGTPPPQARPVG